MNYYNTFVQMNKAPKDSFKDNLQEFVNQKFAASSTFSIDVEEEKEFGSLEFKKIIARVNTLVDAKTGQRINDDYKKIIFPDIDYHPSIGTRYRFDNNIWIVFSTDNIKTATSAVYVRRCNNTINTQDEYGNIHCEPCYIDYKITENQIFRNYSIDVPSGRIYVECQKNKYTQNIAVNTRMIFDEEAYKVRQRSKFDRRNTFDKDSSKMVSFYADVDNVAEDDNIELGIANYKDYIWRVDTKNIFGVPNELGVLTYKVYLNDEIVETSVKWTSTNPEIATIDENGNYNLLKEGDCYFEGTIDKKKDFVERVFVKVKSSYTDIYTTMLFPETSYICLNETIDYTVYEYKNGQLIDTKFEIECFDAPQKNYYFVTDGNHFSITNLKSTNDILLKVKYTNTRTKESKYILIELGGIV